MKNMYDSPCSVFTFVKQIFEKKADFCYHYRSSLVHSVLFYVGKLFILYHIFVITVLS